MIRWVDRLEFKILFLAIALPLVGVLVISGAVLSFLRSGLVDLAEKQSGSTAEAITANLERSMIGGSAELTKEMVEDLRRMSGVEQIDVINGEGREAFSPESPALEKDAVTRLGRVGEPFSVRTGSTLVFYRPLLNGPQCMDCHDERQKVLGATKVAVSLDDVFEQGSTLIAAAFFWSILGVVAMGLLLWLAVRKLVVVPVKKIQSAALAFAEGDLGAEAAVESRDEIGKLWSDLRASIQTTGAVISRINELAGRVGKVSDETEKVSAEVVRSTGIEAEAFSAIASSMEEFNASIGEISEGLSDLSSATEIAHSASLEMSKNIEGVAQSTGDLSLAVAEVTSTTGEMSHTIRELSWGAQNISEVSSQTLAAVQAVERSIEAVRENARESAASSEGVVKDAEELGMQSVRKTLGGMEKISGSFNRASEYITSLGGRSKQIGEIVDVINDVNDQTSLLALNAAILAAQAGEHGKGFQVVAGEIRKLANRTAGSTVEISELINNVQGEVSGAVTAMGEGREMVEGGFDNARESGTALEKIVASARQSAEKSSSIRELSSAQSEGLGKVKDAMERLDQMTRFLAQGTAEQKREADSIAVSVEHVQAAVNHIRSATEEQKAASRHYAEAAEKVSSGTKQMSRAIRDEKDGSGQIMQSLGTVLDLPGRNRALALKINQGLRSVLGDADLLKAEVQSFTVPDGDRTGALRMGVVPLESPAVMFRRFSPLAAWLSRCLGRNVTVKVALDFNEAIEDLGRGTTQFAYLTPSTYVQARKRHGVRLLAKAVRDGKPYQHSVIIAGAQSGIEKVEDLRGRSFAFGDRNSTSSHIVPRATLLEHGITLDDLGFFGYLGHHDDVARAVLKGDYDAGGVMEAVALRNREKGLVLVHKSPPIPEFNFCASPLLPDAEGKALSEALLDLSTGERKKKEILACVDRGYDGFIAADDGDYEGIRVMMAGLGLIDVRDSEHREKEAGTALPAEVSAKEMT